MTHGKNQTIAGVLALFIAAPVFGDMAGATPEFEDGATRPVTIALLPPRASVSTQRLVKSESLVEESTEFGDIFAAKVAAVLEGQGYVVELIDSDRINADPVLREHVIDATRRYDEMTTQLRPRRIKRRIYNAGDEARILADYLNVDALVFAELNVVGATGGKKALSWALGGSTGGSIGTMSVVDGTSADLEAYFVGGGSGSSKKFEEDPDIEIVKIAERMVKKLPDADPSARVARESNDDDVLSEIESLLDN